VDGSRAPYKVTLAHCIGGVASSGFDGAVRLWEGNTSTCLRILRPERRYERLDITVAEH
jgi:hypothetical protein